MKDQNIGKIVFGLRFLPGSIALFGYNYESL